MLKKFVFIALVPLFLGLSPQNAALAQGIASNEAPKTAKLFSPAQLQEDLAFIKKSIATVHPDVGYSADLKQLDRVYQEIGNAFQKPMGKDAAWRELARLNPYFADGHLSVSFGSVRAEADTHLAMGQGFFPFEVYVDPEANLFIRAELDGTQCELKGAKIESINGVSASAIVKELLQRRSGDTPALRENLLTDRFWFPFVKMFGAPEKFDLTLSKEGKTTKIQRAATKDLPKAVKDLTNFDQQYQFEILNKHTALLTLRTFAWEQDEKAYIAFIKQAFAKISEAKISHLMIDIRDNGGGNDSMWKEVLRYIADQPFRNGSTYRKRVLAGRQSGTEKVGDIVDGVVDTWVQPDMTNPYFFKGKTYVLVGRTTYSSSVLFSNVVQDFGFAKLVGQAGYARSRQTGGINQLNISPNTGLEIVIPRFIVDRPSGKRTPVLVTPDIVLPDSPYDDRVLVQALLAQLGRN